MRTLPHLVLLTALLVATLPASTADAAAPSVGPSVAVIGGTISSRFSDEPGSASQAWWSLASRRVGATSITVSAEGGSSITAAGNKCRGTTFGQRLGHLRKVDILIVEVGTDLHRACVAGAWRTLKAEDSRRRIQRFVGRLAARVDTLGISRDRVFFVSPRGPKAGERSAILRSYVKKYASRSHAGFRYIETPRLHTRETIDGIQPNLAGHRVIGQAVVQAIAWRARTARTPAPSPAPGGSMMVIGDSITSWYSNEAGSRSQGWWSILAGQLGVTSLWTSAEGGSGMNVRGNRCHGTTFGDRLGQVRRVDLLVVEVGRNDYKRCGTDQRSRYVTLDEQRPGIEAYVKALSAKVAELGMRPDQVWFVTPWGTRDVGFGAPIQDLIRTAVTAPDIGFGFVETPELNDRQTIDGVHPNRAGNELLAAILAARIRVSS